MSANLSPGKLAYFSRLMLVLLLPGKHRIVLSSVCP